MHQAGGLSGLSQVAQEWAMSKSSTLFTSSDDCKQSIEVTLAFPDRRGDL